ncbi:hypothetical protein ADL00_34035 [Streptomyces sp. AS58]|nr:hypothetical protein ADL00_34035 [Streptomyces sp. AS58]
MPANRPMHVHVSTHRHPDRFDDHFGSQSFGEAGDQLFGFFARGGHGIGTEALRGLQPVAAVTSKTE